MSCSAIVLHSGGMDSSICLRLAIDRFGKDQVISLGFDYNQRHLSELQAAATIASLFGVRRKIIQLPMLLGWEESSLIDSSLPISNKELPNSFVPARNGFFLLAAAPLARQLGVNHLFMGVMEQEGANSGYPDCSSAYIQAVQTLLRLDNCNSLLTIETPLIHMTKKETLTLADKLGILDLLLKHTITCYEGIGGEGCTKCPACRLRNTGLREFYANKSQ